MAVAIRTITRLQDADDVNVSLGAGVDEYALSWDNDTAKFVLRAVSGGGVTDHGALTGLSDDDHSQYLLATGARTGASSQAQAFTNGIIGPTWKPATDSTTALQLRNAAGDYVLNVDTSNKLIGIGTDTPGARLHVKGSSSLYTLFKLSDTKVGYEREWSFSAEDSIFDIKDITAGNIIRLAISSNGNVGIGTASPGTLLHGLLESSATNAVTNVVTIGHDTSGTAAAGFGAGLLYKLESSTTAGQSAARIQVLWNDATHATRKADLVLTAYDTAEREGLRIRGAGSAPAIGFYGVTPIARATLATGAGASVDDVITALQNLGLVKQS